MFFIKWKIRNHLIKIHLLHLLADENEYNDDKFVVVLTQKRFQKLILKFSQI